MISLNIFQTRTSRNAWVGRHSSPIIQNLYSRASHLLRIPEPRLNENVEDLQVVYYKKGQKYDAHHDWFVVFIGDCIIQLTRPVYYYTSK